MGGNKKVKRKRFHSQLRWPVRSPLSLLNQTPAAYFPSAGGFQPQQNPMRSARSHESLLSYSTTTHMIDLGSGEVSFAPIHPSVVGTPNCIQISTNGGATKYYACRTPAERDRWVESLRKTMQPNQDSVRRTENSLQLSVLEAKGIQPKRKYFCELCFDNTLYARTSAKLKTDMCFWGEQFEFNHLPKVEMVCLNLFREADRKKKKDRSTLIGYVMIPVPTFTSRHPVEKWYQVTGSDKSSAVKGETPSIRVKARYQSVNILPLRAYNGLLQFVQSHYLKLSLALEPALSVKAKEDFATSLVRVLQKQQMAKDFLCDLIMAEVDALDNDHLMFRGNSLATKAMEAYMKLVGDHYLQDTLGEFIRAILESDDDLEVDPLKLTNLASLEKHQKLLTFYVEAAWGKMINSFTLFPPELRQVFRVIRERMAEMGREELSENVISSSIFLRFLCPAILSPSLFNLVTEYPSGTGARNLTLIAKTIQTLANFTKFGGKEHYMEFMNTFVEKEWGNMKQFLHRISSTLPIGRREFPWEGTIDMGKELSLLHSYLVESWDSLNQDSQSEFETLYKQLEMLSDGVNDPSHSLNSQSPISPMSDYDNNDLSPPLLQRATPAKIARSLHTTDDYVIEGALNDNLTLRHMGFTVQQSRQRPRPPPHHPLSATASSGETSRHSSITAKEAVNGRTDGLIYVDDTPTQRSSPQQAKKGSQLSIVGASSGYNSLNHSSNSTASSSSNSPIERQSKPPTSLPLQQPPLSIANPLYSLQTIPLAAKRATAQSLPDIQASLEREIHTENLLGKSHVLTPDSSFEEAAGHLWLSKSTVGGAPRTNPRYLTRSPRSTTSHPASPPKAAVPPVVRRSKTTENGFAGSHDYGNNGSYMSQSQESLEQRDYLLIQQRLQQTEDRLKAAESREYGWRSKYEQTRPWSEQVKPIISRLRNVELELHEELSASQKKQAIIDAQQRKIESLLSANQKLMSTLCHIKGKYVDDPSHPPDSPPPIPPARASSGVCGNKVNFEVNGGGFEENVGSPQSEESFESNSSMSSGLSANTPHNHRSESRSDHRPLKASETV